MEIPLRILADKSQNADDDVASIAVPVVGVEKIFRGAMPEDDEPGGVELRSKATGCRKRPGRGLVWLHHGAHNTQNGIDRGAEEREGVAILVGG